MKSLRFFIMALLCAVANVAWGQSDYSTDYTGNITLTEATNGVSNASACKVIINENEYSGLKCGTASKVGAFKIKVPTGIQYVHLHLAGWKDSQVTLTVTPTGYSENITLTANSGITNSSPFTFDGDASSDDYYKVIDFGNALQEEKELTFTPGSGKRFVVFGVTYEKKGIQTTVAKPVFNPSTGSYTAAQNVTISCSTEGATIYYTTNGSEPSTSSTKYTAGDEISVTQSGTTLKAIAVKQGLTNSTVASATYTIIPENPSITQEGNTITMSAATGCTIYYNTGTNNSDTNDPTNASTPYTEPIEMTESAYFKAIAYDEYGNPSGIKSFDFKYSNVIPHPKNINSNYYVKVTDASELEDGDAILIVGENNNNFYAMGNQKDNNRDAVEVTVNNDAITITEEDETVQRIIFVDASDNDNLFGYFYVGENGYLYAASSSTKNYLRSESIPDDKAKASIEFVNNIPTVTFQTGTEIKRNILLFNYNGGSPLFNCYASNSSTGTNIEIYKEVLAPFELVIHPKATDGNNNYYATISNLGKGNFVVPKGLEVSTITIVNRNINKTQSWTKDGVIPGDKAYYVVAAGLENPTPDDLTFTFVPSTNTEVISLQDNWLYPAIAGQLITAPDDENEYLFYKLTLDANDTDGSIGFYFGDDNGGTFSFSNDHKAYLAVPQNGDSNEGMSSIVVGDFTGISDIQPNKEQNNEVYTLSGVRVKGNLPKGIYIVNGKKQIVK